MEHSQHARNTRVLNFVFFFCLLVFFFNSVFIFFRSNVTVLSDLNLVSVLSDRNFRYVHRLLDVLNLIIVLCFQSTNLKFLA